MTDRTSIGPYRIVARVGAGGMGEVFKAWDPRLERDVAIKLLHREAASDPERQKRLLAEGRAASALNHPNILRVYDADVHGDAYYLVSEWLEGKSLRDELARGAVPLKRLLDLAVQIADGLAAAHAMGIVHRDIKPENIMLARDGTARIVDFGLARGEHRATATAETVAHSTVSLEGGISGTPAYMSPEQARGTLGDFRTDQFSFGALLYELATGRHAFRRDSLADTLTAVLHEEPRPILELNPRIPAALRWIIEQCLAKDAGERYGATEDLARELRRIRDRLIEALAEPRLADPGPAPQRRWWPAAALLGAALVIGSVITLLTWTETTPVAMKFLPLASAAPYEGEPAWSADALSIAYVADVDGVLQVFVRRLGDPVSRQVTSGRFDAQHPFWSLNGQLIYFISPAGNQDALWSVAAAGGRPDVVQLNVSRAALDPNGTRLALFRDDETAGLRKSLWWSSQPGADPTREARAPFAQMRGTDGRLAFSRRGQLLVWLNGAGQDPVDPDNFQTSFYLFPSGNGSPRVIFPNLTNSQNLPSFTWLPDDRRVVLAIPDQQLRRHLWIADTRSGTVRQLTATHTNETDPAVSPDGRLVAYASDEVDFDLALIAPDGQSRRPMLSTARNEYAPVWAPAGDRFAFVTDRTGEVELWERSKDGQWERPIVTATDFGGSAAQTIGSLSFSPDGKTIAYQRGDRREFAIWLSPAGGGTPIRLTAPEAGYQDAPRWSPDGEWVAYTQNTQEDKGDRLVLMKTRIGRGDSKILADGLAYFTPNVWSPDGRWIMYQSVDGLMRVAADGGTPELISSDTLFGYEWAPDSRRVFALSESETTGHFAFVEIDSATQNSRTLNPDLGPIPIANQPIRGFSFAKGHGFLTSLASARSDIWLLEGFELPRRGILDWFRR